MFDADPGLGDPYKLSGPELIPAANSPAADGVAPLSDGWLDVEADYMGAFEPPTGVLHLRIKAL